MKKLSLEKNTVRELTNADVNDVVGGVTDKCSGNCNTDLQSNCQACPDTSNC
ncbi:MAG: hypothetical protein R3B81_02400 [bacterium]